MKYIFHRSQGGLNLKLLTRKTGRFCYFIPPPHPISLYAPVYALLSYNLQTHEHMIDTLFSVDAVKRITKIKLTEICGGK